RECGAQIAPYEVETLSAAWTFLAATENSLDDELAGDAYLAALLKPEDARRATVALGIPQDLVPLVRLDAVDSDLAGVIGRSASSQALVAATVMFCLHDRAARAGRSERANQ